jgi:hypothetical protein
MNPKLSAIFTASTIVAALSACSNVPSAPAKLIKTNDDPKGMMMVDFPAERRGGWMIPQADGSYRVCSEPPTDVGINANQLLSVAAELQKLEVGGNGSIDSSLMTSIVELKGRTPAVLALRDVMFRMCEARATGSQLPPDEIKVYEQIVSVIADFAQADLANAQEKQQQANAAAGGSASNLSLARMKEQEGFDALSEKNWDAAKKAFSASESAYPSYGWSYEYARALGEGGTDKQQAQRILNLRGRMPSATKQVLSDLVK